MQNKRNGMRALTLMIVLAMMLGIAAGCNARVSDPVVGKVGDIDINYSSYYNAYTNYKYYYSMMGTYDVSTSEKYREFQDMIFDMLIDSMLPVYVAKQNNVTLTDEEEAEVQVSLEEQLVEIYGNYSSRVDSSITDEAEILAAEKEFFLAEIEANGWTLETYSEALASGLRDSAIAQKYVDSLIADVTVTDDEVRAYYDEQLAYYQERYAEDAAAYYTDYTGYLSNGGLQPLVAPEGYSYYKHILILAPEEGEEKDVDAIIAEILEKIENGEDFDALIEEYGEDPGMQNEPYMDTGYILSEANADSYYAEFSAAALALENEGDISDPVESQSGTHIIIKLGPVSTDVIPLEDVQDTVRETVQEQKENDLYAEYLEQWKTEVKIVKHYDRVTGLR